MNGLVGEREIQVGGLKLGLRPDFEALTQIETMTSRSLVKVLDDFTTLAPKLGDMATILWCCHKSYDPASKISRSEIGGAIMKDGMQKHVVDVFTLISYALGGGEEGAKKNAGEAPEK